MHADNWAQIPNLTMQQRGFDDIDSAIRQARRVIQVGGNNVSDTVRVYRRPALPTWLKPELALASLRRNGRRIEVELHRKNFS